MPSRALAGCMIATVVLLVIPAPGDAADLAPPAYQPRGLWERLRTDKIHRVELHVAEEAARALAAADLAPCQVVADVPYGPCPQQRVDLYLPCARPFPVLVYVHGGSWVSEDKAMYALVGRYFAAHGVGVVLVNYRLPPEGSVEDEVRDAAAAVAWTVAHIGAYGGDAGRLFLCGHSSGGHLVGVLATDPCYLGAVGLTPCVLRGVITLGGVFRVNANVELFGVGYAFEGIDHAALSPVRQVRPCPPPFLLVVSEHGNRFFHRQARCFRRRLVS